MRETVKQVDAELLKVHEEFLRADGQGDVAAATEAWLRLDELLDERTHIPQQRHPEE